METKTNYDPTERLEGALKTINDNTGLKTRSILKKYPITFSLLITFSLVSILHGFELVFNKVAFIQNNPWVLILLGLAILIITGSVYKALENHK